MHGERHLPALAAAILAEPVGARLGGYELTRTSGLRPGVVYPLLTHLLDAGWLTDGWTTDRHPRRYYVVTDDGRAMLTDLGTVCQ